jgi:hypothetical protein
MRRQIALALLALCLAPSLAIAGTFPVPKEKPIATVSIPDSWSPKVTDAFIEASSADGYIYLAFESINAADANSAIEEALGVILAAGDEVDRASKKTKDIKINDLDASQTSYTGKDKVGPTNIRLTLIKTNAPAKLLLFTYWGSANGEATNGNDLKAISDSIQATR